MLGLDPVVRAYIAWTVSRRGSISLAAIQDIWPIVVGRAIARRTRPKGLQAGCLDVGVPDGVWLSELRFQSDRILTRLRAVLPADGPHIESLRFSVGGQPPWEPVPAAEAEPGPPIPLTAEQREALEAIDDPELRALVERVVERDQGRPIDPSTPTGRDDR